MKKLFLLVALTAIIHMKSNAQSADANFMGTSILSAGIGVGSPFFGAGYSNSFPVNPTISYERGVLDQLTVGGEFSYASSKFSYNDGFSSDNYTITYRAIYVGARGAYHLASLLSLPQNIDVYGGATVGYVIVSVSDNAGNAAALGSTVGYGGFAGGRLYLTPGTAVYAELGYQSLSYLNIGLSFKL